MDNKAILSEIAKHSTILDFHIKRLNKRPEQLHDIDIEMMGEKVKEIYFLVNNLLPEDDGFEVSSESEVRSSELKESGEDRETKIEERGAKTEERGPKAEGLPTKEEPPASSLQPPEPSPVPRPPSPEPKVSSDLKERVEERETKSEERETKNEERKEMSEERETKNEIREAISEETVIEEEPAASSSQPTAPGPQLPEPAPEPISASRDPQPASPETPEPKTTADLFSGPTTIADKFQAREDNSIAAKVNTQPSEDLKMSIGINDKFLFINELFQGDPSVYNMAIENMNAAGGLDDALKSIDTYREKYQWADNSEAYHRLKKIVNSKFNG